MRMNQTSAERKLWQQIRRRQVHGVKFRRQHVIDHFIVDFCSLSIRLIIEVDSPSHEDSREADVLRQSVLESYGFEVARFKNEAVLRNIEGVMDILYDVVERRKTPPYPSPSVGREFSIPLMGKLNTGSILCSSEKT